MSKSQRASIISRPLLKSVAESMVIFRPMTQEGCLQGALDGDGGEFLLGRGAERAAGRCQPQRAHRGRRLAVQALENGRMLAVHRQHAHAVFARLAHDDFPAMTRISLEATAMSLPARMAARAGLQSGGADDGDEHDVRRRQRGQLEQTFLARINAGGSAQRVFQFARLGRIAQWRWLRAGAGAFASGAIRVVAGGQADQADLVRQILGHLEGARADGTGGTKKNDSFHYLIKLAVIDV
jgi:hypothetical protein